MMVRSLLVEEDEAGPLSWRSLFIEEVRGRCAFLAVTVDHREVSFSDVAPEEAREFERGTPRMRKPLLGVSVAWDGLSRGVGRPVPEEGKSPVRAVALLRESNRP